MPVAEPRRVRDGAGAAIAGWALGDRFPCREHGGWCEVCEEFRPVIVPARFVDARICEDCAATEPALTEDGGQHA